MRNTTILIQGRLTKDSLEFYKNNYQDYPKVLSLWNDNNIDLSDLTDDFKVILSEKPTNGGRDNRNFQTVSVLNGLELVDTEYVIKMRADEYISNIDYVIEQISLQDDKLYCLPIFFRPWSVYRYHISDHLIAGSKTQLLNMFSTAYEMSNDNFYDRYCNEQFLTLAFLHKKYPDVDFYDRNNVNPEFDSYQDNSLTDDKLDGRMYFVKSFEILDLQRLKPYQLVANVYGKIFKDFIPEGDYSSISRISMVFNTKEQYDSIAANLASNRTYIEQPIPVPGDFYQ